GGVELYAMAGVGIAQVNINAEATIDYDISYSSGSVTLAVDTHETTLAYQLGAGISIPVSKGVKLDARYRYFATTDFNLNALVNVEDLSSHSALVGLRVDL
ncbi:MAG: outer membrane beta-barrel protein, partial [Chlorobiaceae bacterium]|nr:outer membrane beta-barrel protein [Chlorobiaceae bacterium]